MMQIDGLGGSRLVTSKVAIVERSARPEADVDYTFAQVDIERDGVGYDGNCGNISSGVGPFAIDEGLVQAVEPVTRVRIHNTNTDKLLVALVPVRKRQGPRERRLRDRRCARNRRRNPDGLFGHGRREDGQAAADRAGCRSHQGLEDGGTVTATLCDAGNPCVFVQARDLGLTGSELPAEITADAEALARIFEIQAKAHAMLGFSVDWRSVDPGRACRSS